MEGGHATNFLNLFDGDADEKFLVTEFVHYNPKEKFLLADNPVERELA